MKLVSSLAVRLWAALSASLLAPTPSEGSIFYDFTVIAADNSPAPGGGVLTGVEPNVSVNEDGEVAFIASVPTGTPPQPMEQLLLGFDALAPVNISRSPSARNFDFPQINNQGLIVDRELAGGFSVIRVWDSRLPGRFNLIQSTTRQSDFSQLTLPGISDTPTFLDEPLVSFIGRIADTTFGLYANDTLQFNLQDSVSPLTGTPLTSFRSSVAGRARAIAAQFTGDKSSPQASVRRLAVWTDLDADTVWDRWEIAATSSDSPWRELGVTPAISETGQCVVFAGEHSEWGRGIFVALSTNGFTTAPEVFPVITTKTVISNEESGRPIHFETFDFDNRIAITQQDFPPLLNPTGDVLTLAFIATPEKKSMPIPSEPGLPLYFSAGTGLWTLRIDIENELDPQDGPPQRRLHPANPIPVIQTDDLLDGSPVESITLWDPLAVPALDPDRQGYNAQPADHYIAFSVGTPDGRKVVRGAHFDADADGLLDHWEKDGIDMDGDGDYELDLPTLGAKRLRADLFLEVDWLNDRTAGVAVPYSLRPAPGMTRRLAQMFANAPVANPDGTTGITLHVDAGPGYDETGDPYSINLEVGSSMLDGGDRIYAQGNPDGHIDHVFLGWPDESPGIPGLVSKSLFDIKHLYFGRRDLRAREFVFKYCVFADSHRIVRTGADETGRPYVGQVSLAGSDFLVPDPSTPLPKLAGGLKIVQGQGAGQVRRVDWTGSTLTRLHLVDRWAVIPDVTSRFVLLDASGGVAEVSFWNSPDMNSRPGNDLILSLGLWSVNPGGWLSNGEMQWRTLAHQIGSSMGLRRGGNNHVNSKANFYSLMNYRFQLALDSGVEDYSRAGDPVFDDWGYAKFDFFRSLPMLEKSPTDNSPREPSPDLTPPTIVITSPVLAANCSYTVAPGSTLQVTAVATDNVAVKWLLISFDRNGDGDESDEGETVSPVFVPGPGHWTASFANVTGPAGLRYIRARAADTSGNMGHFVIPVTAGADGAGVVTLLNQAGTFAAQTAAGARQKVVFSNVAVPASGRVLIAVTGTPAFRQSGTPTDVRHDAEVRQITRNGQAIALRPVCNPAGCTPSVCTSYWVAPTGGGPIDIEVLGPARYDADGVFLGSPTQGYTVKVTFAAQDVTPPAVSVIAPAVDSYVETGEPLEVRVSAADDFGVARVEADFDLNGDGDVVDAGEKLTAASIGAGVYRASFAVLTGAPGARRLVVRATDTAGLTTTEVAGVTVQLRDTVPPSVVINAPPSGWPVKQGTALAVQVTASDDIEMEQVEVTLDLNGDGDVVDAGETVLAPRTGVNVYTHTFEAVAGPTGSRTLRVTARDKAQNTTPTSRPVTVISAVPVPVTLLTDANHIIPASPSQFNGGFQRVVDYTPITLPRSGVVTFKVTSTPNVRQAVQNIPRADPYVRKVWLNGVERLLNPTCNDFGSNPSICETSFEAAAGGSLDFQVLGPGVWNTFGEFVGTPEVTYTLVVSFVSTDHTLPVVAVTSPALGANQALNTAMTVNMTVTDDTAVAAVSATFDVNGDGDLDDLGEQVSATPLGGSGYRASFGPVTGPPGNRAIVIQATDTAFNTRRTEHSVGVDGAGGGATVVKAQSGVIPGQPNQFSGGSRQTVPVNGIAVPGMGRLIMTVTSLPNVRQAVTNLERYDAEIRRIVFNGEAVNLTPACNAPGSNPAICTSTWDSPGAGTLNIEIRGPAEYNIWGEFTGTPNQEYQLEVMFIPGPTVTSVTPATGSIGGGETVTVRGAGFGAKALVLFGDVAATQVTRVNGTELRCLTPPGVNGAVTVTVLNADDSTAPHSFNYGSPYGLFGRLANGFTYTTPATPPVSPLGERLIGTWRGSFPAVAQDGERGLANLTVTTPGTGQVRFEVHAFVPILNPIAGPPEDRTDLLWANSSSVVTAFRDATNTARPLTTTSTDISNAWGPVITSATAPIPTGGVGASSFTLSGPARWNAFWREFGDFVMVGAPAQTWVVAAWHVTPHTVTSLTPSQGPMAGGTTVTIKGTNFTAPAEVYFGQHQATNVVVTNATTLTCRTPQAFASEVVDVTVYKDGRAVALPGSFRFVEGSDYCVPVPEGLVSWWAGDTGGNDLRGLNHASLKNGATTGTGFVGNGFVLDGVDDHAEAPVGRMSLGTRDFTLEAWAKTSATKNYSAVASFDVAAPGFFIRGNGALQLYPANPSPAAALNDGQWHHIAVVRHNGALTYYKDGTAIGTAPFTGSLTPSRFLIGSSLNGAEFFAGQIDELAVYNRALTEADVRLLFIGGSLGKCRHDTDHDGLLDAWESAYGLNPASAADATSDLDSDGLTALKEFAFDTDPRYSDSDSDGAGDGYEFSAGSDPGDAQFFPPYMNATGLLAWWNFDSTVSATAVSDRVHGFSGELAGGATVTNFGGGRTGGTGDRALDVTRPQADRLSVDDARWLNAASLVDTVTFSFWQKTSAVVNGTSFHAVSPSAEASRGAQAHVPWGDTSIAWDTTGWSSPTGSRITAASPPGFNHLLWHHFAFVKKGDTKEIWIDGAKVATGTNTFDLRSDLVRLVIGAYDPPSGSTQAQAFIDDFAVFADALTPAQIQRLAAGARPDALAGPGAELTVSPAALDFGLVPAAQSAERTFVLRNTGSTAVTVSSVSFSAAGFALARQPLPLVVEPGASLPVAVRCSPSNHGPMRAVVTFDGNVDATAEVTAVGLNPAAPAGLMAWWPFDDSTNAAGSTDAVHGFTGIWRDGAKHSAAGGGRTGAPGDRSADFTATTLDHLKVADARWFQAASALDKVTIAFWEKTTALADSMSFHFNSPTAEDRRGASAHCPWSDGRIYWDTSGWRSTATQRLVATAPAGHNYALWHHYALVKNGSTKEVWIDGVRVATGTNTLPLVADVDFLNIGSGDQAYGLRGYIDDFAVFSGALTQSQLQQLAAGATPPSVVVTPPGDTFRVTTFSVNPLTRAVTLNWNSQAGVVYAVEQSADLKSWQLVQGGITGTGATTSVTTPPPPAGTKLMFYRVTQ